MQSDQKDAFTDLADNLPLPLEFVILEAEEELSYKIVRIGEFPHVLGFSRLHLVRGLVDIDTERNQESLSRSNCVTRQTVVGFSDYPLQQRVC